MIPKPDTKKEPLPGKETASSSPTIQDNPIESQGYKSIVRADEVLKVNNKGDQQNPTSNHKGYRLEERLMDVVSAPDLHNEKLEKGTFLPLLGQQGFIIKLWSILIAGYPKIGKTELVIRLISEWLGLGESILYLTEEPRSVWHTRLEKLNTKFPPNFRIGFALGHSKKVIAEILKVTPASIVIIDTIRNLLGLENENDNSEIAGILNPFIALARDKGKTLILLHHTRKGGGMYGEAVSGGHAFLGTVDVALELNRHVDRKRIIRGSARVFEVPTLMYEMTKEGEFVVLGNPDELAIEEVRDRLLENLTNNWVTTSKARELIGKPEPSNEQVRQALEHLAFQTITARDPPTSEGSRPGKTYQWRKLKGGVGMK